MADKEYRDRRVELLIKLKDECDRMEADAEQFSQYVAEFAADVSAQQRKIDEVDQSHSEAQGFLWDIEPAYEAAKEAFAREKLRYTSARERVEETGEAQEAAYDEMRCKKEKLQVAKPKQAAKREAAERARKDWEVH